MYLLDLVVKNVKLLRDVKLSFTRADGSPRMWTVFVGENRSCKTTLLQTIAAVASGSDQATHLATDVIESWPDLRREAPTCWLRGMFGFSARSREYPGYGEAGSPPPLMSPLQLHPGRTVFDGGSHYHDYLAEQERPDPLATARRENTPGWFVAGYGVRRMLRGPASLDTKQRDPSRDRLRPLFGDDVIGTGFIELLSPELGRAFVKTLQQVFVAGGLLPHVTTLELRGRGGIRSVRDLVDAQRFEMDICDDQGARIRVPATWLSQGYQSIIAWLADLVGQLLLDAGEPIEAAAMEGCVLVDEIDMFLHPKWQLRLIPALKQVFPRLQFIATTHSPMVLPALSADEIVLLTHDDEGSVVATPATRSPALLTGTELFDAFFEIDKLYPSELGAKLSRYSRIAADPTRTDEEEAAMLALRGELAGAGVELDWEPVAREPAA